MADKKKRRLLPKILLFSILVSILMYLVGYFIFSKYSYPNTFFNNKYSGLKPLISISEAVEMRNISITDINGNVYYLDPQDLNFESKYDDDIKIRQNQLLWPIEIFKKNEYESHVTKSINDENLMKWIEHSELITNQVSPVDAKIVKNDTEFVIEKEVLGSTINKNKLFNTIKSAYLSSENEIILKDEYLAPKIVEEDLKEKLEVLNSLNRKNLIIKAPDATEISVVDNIDKFINLESNTIDRDKIYLFVNSLKGNYDNTNNERKFKTFNNEEIVVPPGNFGVQINLDASVAAIYETLTNLEDVTSNIIELIYTNNAFNNGIIGNTYVEISLLEQRMVFYKDGNLIVDTPVVTGLPNGIYNTPRGIWNVWIKESNRYLEGKNLDGSKYKSFVNFWMQIDHTGVGIHDSSWQYAYGGSLYQSVGSHGCINTPYEATKTIYENIDMGTPVIIY